MNTQNKLNHLAPVADEMLAGLQADEAMRLRIVRAAREKAQPGKKNKKRFAPAAAFALAALVCVGVATTQLNGRMPSAPAQPVTIGEIAAGDPVISGALTVADLGDGASVRMARSGGESIFAEGGAEIPVVTVNGNVYRMLNSPQDIGSGLLKKMGSVCVTTDQPSLASDAELSMGLSNVAKENAAIYSIDGIAPSTAVAAEVDGSVRLFQRVSYAGRGPTSSAFADTFAVKGQVKLVSLDGRGTVTGSAAEEVVRVLCDKATLKSADGGSARQYLTVTLDNGLKLHLGVSGDTVIGCGAWSCPEFFEAFEKAMQ
ncbi:MAG: hypothetical protein IKU34_09895 [Clostridia bacterium]|nr:hypothetical protein [Clostridia bacterium]